MDFVDVTVTSFARSPKTLWIMKDSILSFSPVEVPCALT